MVQLVNVLAAKLVDSGSVLRTHMAGGDKCSYRLFLDVLFQC